VRRLFNALTLLSLLGFIAATALLVRSTRTRDFIFHAANGRCLVFDTDKDSLWIERYDNWPTEEPLRWLSAPKGTPLGPRKISPHLAPARTRVALDPQDRLVLHGAPMAHMHWSAPTPRRVVYWLRFSNWIALCMPLPLAWLSIRVARWTRTRRRQRRGLCPDCGYDLRATPGRCPECGKTKSEELAGAADQ
jgi:hypothetical protein